MLVEKLLARSFSLFILVCYLIFASFISSIIVIHMKMNLCLNFVTFIIKLDFLKHLPIGTIRWWRRIQGEMGRWIRRSITRASSPSSCTTSASISSWDRHSDDNISSCCCHLELEKAVVVSTSSSLIWLLLLS